MSFIYDERTRKQSLKVPMVQASLLQRGLGLNGLCGWWWADPLASLVIVYDGIQEAIHALHESSESAESMDILRKDL